MNSRKFKNVVRGAGADETSTGGTARRGGGGQRGRVGKSYK